MCTHTYVCADLYMCWGYTRGNWYQTFLGFFFSSQIRILNSIFLKKNLFWSLLIEEDLKPEDRSASGFPTSCSGACIIIQVNQDSISIPNVNLYMAKYIFIQLLFSGAQTIITGMLNLKCIFRGWIETGFPEFMPFNPEDRKK